MQRERNISLITWVRTGLVLCLLIGSASAADLVGAVEKGNADFKQQKYKEALEQYQIAETERPESPEIDYNIAGVLHEQGKYENAVDRYTKALNSDQTGLSSKAHYNLGNTYYRMKDYQKAISQYEESLKLTPQDMDAKFNLELARKMLKENMKPQQKKQDQQQQQKKQQQQQQKQQKQEDKKKQDQQKKDEQQKKQNQQKQQQQQGQQSQPQKVSKEDAERILNALRDDEKDVQKKVHRQVVQGEYTGKDW